MSFFYYQTQSPFIGQKKSCYYFYDSAVAKYFGANVLICAQTWLLNEILSQKTYRLDQRWNAFHYQTSRGSQIPFAVTSGNHLAAYKLTLEENVKLTELEVLKVFLAKSASAKTEVHLIAPVNEAYTEKRVKVHPLQAII